MRRLRAATAALMVGLALGALPVLAQHGSDASDEVATELLFEVVLPPQVMSDWLERITTGGLIIAPGVDASIGTDNEAMRGRMLYVESGELEVAPMVDAPVWQGDAALGGLDTIVPAGEPVRLAPGDFIFIPVIASADLVPGATTVIANRGAETAVTRGLHAHAYESFEGWPEEISDSEGSAVLSDTSVLAAVVAGDMTFRSSRLTAPVGSSLPLDATALFTLVDVYDGKVERTASGPAGKMPPFWNPIHGGYVAAHPDWTFDLTVAGDSPAIVHE